MEGFETYELLVSEIGEEAAKKVFDIFAGSNVHFPKKIIRQQRDQEIIRRFKEGESYEELARAFGLSPQWIRAITSKKKNTSKSSNSLKKFLN